jgi:hypothetical protein
VNKGSLKSHDVDELEKKCRLKNPANYGGCLAVRKKWLLCVNGYEQHPIFQTGSHANGLDMYTRFKNFGLAVQWEPSLKLYHPWHVFSLTPAMEYIAQKKLIDWRKRTLQWQALSGIDSSRDFIPPHHVKQLLEQEMKILQAGRGVRIRAVLKKHLKLFKTALFELKTALN